MIRTIKDEDIPIILGWYNHYILTSAATFEEETIPPEEFKARIRRITEEYPWIVLEKENKPVGYAYLSHFNPRHAYRFTADIAIYIDPKETGKGYGKILLEALIGRAKQCGYQKLVSLVTVGNAASEALHESFGFVKQTVMEKAGYKFGRWQSVNYFVLDIGSFPENPDEPINPEVR
ncbi:MAG: N-acetyltransferase [Solobacterium sp.]|nr:N-acetyltransferase [Solobacterium sp.]